MKALLHSLTFLILFTFFFAPGLVQAQDDPNADQDVSFQTFYDQLGDQGTWVQTDDYGYVFQPNVQDQDWAPYKDGHWVDSDDGWTWVSDEPWGWATYHYGRWANIDGMGWVWVPGYRWAPAWVSWRYGGGYAGWAPLPPETFEGAEYGDAGSDSSLGFHFGNDVDVSFDIGPGCYNFVPVEYLGERDYRSHYAHRDNNFVIINNTRNITNINVNRNRANGRNAGFRGVSVGGPSLNEVNAHSHQHIQKVNLTASNQPGRNTLQGNSLAVFAPRVNPATAQQARPSRVGQTINQPKFNRGNSVTNPLAVSATIKPHAPNAEAIQAAQRAEAKAPATAKIATDKTPAHAKFNKPLSSMTPVGEAPRNVAPQKGVQQPAEAVNSNINPPSAMGEQPDKKRHDSQGTSANVLVTPQQNAVNPRLENTGNSSINPPSATGEPPEKKKHESQGNASPESYPSAQVQEQQQAQEQARKHQAAAEEQKQAVQHQQVEAQHNHQQQAQSEDRQRQAAQAERESHQQHQPPQAEHQENQNHQQAPQTAPHPSAPAAPTQHPQAQPQQAPHPAPASGGNGGGEKKDRNGQ